MTPPFNPYTPPAASDESAALTDASIRIYTVGGVALAGLFGGPLVVCYLIIRNLQVLNRFGRIFMAAAIFLPLILIWLYVIFSVPGDLLSQLIPYFPQVLIWWLATRYVMMDCQVAHMNSGGQSRSKWGAVRFGLASFAILKWIFFLVDVSSGLG